MTATVAPLDIIALRPVSHRQLVSAPLDSIVLDLRIVPRPKTEV